MISDNYTNYEQDADKGLLPLTAYNEVLEPLSKINTKDLENLDTKLIDSLMDRLRPFLYVGTIDGTNILLDNLDGILTLKENDRFYVQLPELTGTFAIKITGTSSIPLNTTGTVSAGVYIMTYSNGQFSLGTQFNLVGSNYDAVIAKKVTLDTFEADTSSYVKQTRTEYLARIQAIMDLFTSKKTEYETFINQPDNFSFGVLENNLTLYGQANTKLLDYYDGVNANLTALANLKTLLTTKRNDMKGLLTTVETSLKNLNLFTADKTPTLVERKNLIINGLTGELEYELGDYIKVYPNVEGTAVVSIDSITETMIEGVYYKAQILTVGFEDDLQKVFTLDSFVDYGIDVSQYTQFTNKQLVYLMKTGTSIKLFPTNVTINYGNVTTFTNIIDELNIDMDQYITFLKSFNDSSYAVLDNPTLPLNLDSDVTTLGSLVTDLSAITFPNNVQTQTDAFDTFFVDNDIDALRTYLLNLQDASDYSVAITKINAFFDKLTIYVNSINARATVTETFAEVKTFIKELGTVLDTMVTNYTNLEADLRDDSATLLVKYGTITTLITQKQQTIESDYATSMSSRNGADTFIDSAIEPIKSYISNVLTDLQGTRQNIIDNITVTPTVIEKVKNHIYSLMVSDELTIHYDNFTNIPLSQFENLNTNACGATIVNDLVICVNTLASGKKELLVKHYSTDFMATPIDGVFPAPRAKADGTYGQIPQKGILSGPDMYASLVDSTATVTASFGTADDFFFKNPPVINGLRTFKANTPFLAGIRNTIIKDADGHVLDWTQYRGVEESHNIDIDIDINFIPFLYKDGQTGLLSPSNSKMFMIRHTDLKVVEMSFNLSDIHFFNANSNSMISYDDIVGNLNTTLITDLTFLQGINANLSVWTNTATNEVYVLDGLLKKKTLVTTTTLDKLLISEFLLEGVVIMDGVNAYFMVSGSTNKISKSFEMSVSKRAYFTNKPNVPLLGLSTVTVQQTSHAFINWTRDLGNKFLLELYENL